MYKVFIDSGHGGDDPGAVFSGVREADINRKVSGFLKGLLCAHRGFDVMCNADSGVTTLNSRCRAANGFGADVFISIHHNAGGGDGYELIHSADALSKGKDIANIIAKKFDLLGQNKRGIYSKTLSDGTDYFAVIRETKMPAVITEFAFIDTSDSVIISSDDKLYLEALAIASAIFEYFNSITPRAPNSFSPSVFFESIILLYRNNIINSPQFWVDTVYTHANPYPAVPAAYITSLMINFAKTLGNQTR